MKPRLLLLGGALTGLLAFVVLLSGADTARAGTFNPTLKVDVADPKPEASSDFTVDFGVPSGDVNFAAVVSFIPKDWGVVPGKELPIGTTVGTLTSQATLGLINGACNSPVPVEFTFLNSSLDTSDTVAYLDEDKNNTGDVFEDKDGNDIKDGIEKYPDFITRLLVDENGQPLQPFRRSAGITVVAGINVLLQFLVFEPGTVINAALPSEVALGYPSVTLLQNIGDPAAVPAPGAITDFCSPLSSTNTSLGKAEDGTPLYVNPKNGTYTFTTIALGQRDADGDGFENSLDTCVFAPNKGDPRVAGSGDGDSDGLDAACDPNDKQTNSDQDADGYLNRQDTCPLIANGQDGTNQADKDGDQIGDECDKVGEGGIGKGPDTADGDLASATLTKDVKIGDGTGPGGPPPGFPRSGGGGGGGGLGTGAIIGIIIGVVAAVIVVGGGAAFAMRRRSS